MLASDCIRFLTIIIVISGITEAQKFRSNSIVREMPKSSDINLYLRSIERMTKFFNENKRFLDIHVYFSLFMSNVNFINILQIKKHTMPKRLHQRLQTLINQNEKLLKTYWQVNQPLLSGTTLSITQLINNTVVWSNRFLKYPGTLAKTLQRLSNVYIQKAYPEWKVYMASSPNELYLPIRQLSDTCLDSLSKNPDKRPFDEITKCQTLPVCYHFLVHGPDLGYGLSHRLLLLLMGRLGRGCSIFSPGLDRELSRRFCLEAFYECKNIASHGFETIDLLMEHITLCTIMGHSEFMVRSWLSTILRFQTPMGCFSQTKEQALMNSNANHIFRELVDRSQILDGQCDSHMTGVATTMLASAVRTLVLIYY